MMITRLVSAIVGLLAFAGCIIGGMIAGNGFDDIILRAIKGLFWGCVVGWFAGKCSEILVHENFREMVLRDADLEIEKAKVDSVYAVAPKEVEDSAVQPDAPDSHEEQTDQEKIDSGVVVNKEVGENGREYENVLDPQETFAARAARELLGDMFKK